MIFGARLGAETVCRWRFPTSNDRASDGHGRRFWLAVRLFPQLEVGGSTTELGDLLVWVCFEVRFPC